MEVEKKESRLSSVYCCFVVFP